MKTTMQSGVTNGMFLLYNYTDSQAPIIESIIETIVEPIIFKC
ncbi:hypothetical protein C8C85_1874 [Flavobacterium sp. 103]|nr:MULTISPECIES: hypothetical protein [unclassified Flavobacterium]PVX46060.1 hypothetical protein C8C85_1874 [Flavobacterium sp. 103]